MAQKQEIIDFLKDEFPQFTATIEEVGERSSVIRHQVRHEDLRPGYTVSGPTLFALADSGLYVAILGELGLVALAVTTNMNINFLNKPAADQDIVAKCQLIKMGKSLIVGEVSLYSEAAHGEARLVAHAVGTYSIPPKRAVE